MWRVSAGRWGSGRGGKRLTLDKINITSIICVHFHNVSLVELADSDQGQASGISVSKMINIVLGNFSEESEMASF